MRGLEVSENDAKTVEVCIITEISSELQTLIRKYLASICHGISVGEADEPEYSFGRTLAEFLKQYSTKPEDTQKGMIGELLTHLIIPQVFKDFQPASSLFNMEERNIKKGFDIILFHEVEKTVYFTEIKSGNANKDTSDEKNAALLSLAKNDLAGKLQEQDSHHWHNAINGAKLSLDEKDTKVEVVRILKEALSDAQNEKADSKSKCVILSSVTYKELSDRITLKRATAYLANCSDFAKTLIISIQNDSHKSIEDFLRTEAGCGN